MHVWTCLFGFAAAVLQIAVVRSGNCRDLDPSLRIDCGWPGIRKLQCESKGCCFDNSIPKSLWCFKKDETSNDIDLTESEIEGTVLRTCAVAPWQRVDCGWPGIRRKLCEKRGCCYDEIHKKSLWCFQPGTVFALPIVEKLLRCTANCLGFSWRKTVKIGVTCGTKSACWELQSGDVAAECLDSCKLISSIQDFAKNVSHCLNIAEDVRLETIQQCDFNLSCWKNRHGSSAPKCFQQFSELLTGIIPATAGNAELDPLPSPQIQMPRVPLLEIKEQNWSLVLELFERDPNTLLTDPDDERSIKYPVEDRTVQEDEEGNEVEVQKERKGNKKKKRGDKKKKRGNKKKKKSNDKKKKSK